MATGRAALDGTLRSFGCCIRNRRKKKAPSFADSHAHHEAARRGVEGTAGIYDSIRLNAATAEGAHRPMRSGRPQSNAHPLHG